MESKTSNTFIRQRLELRYMPENETVTIYDMEVDANLFDDIRDKIEEIDPSKNYGKKHIAKQAIILFDHLLDEKYKEHSKDLDRIKREIGDLEAVLK